MPRQQAGRVAASVLAWGEVSTGAVEPQHLVDEGGADAEQTRDFRDGAVTAQGGGEHPLPQFEGIGFYDAASYFSRRVHSSANRYRVDSGMNSKI